MEIVSIGGEKRDETGVKYTHNKRAHPTMVDDKLGQPGGGWAVGH